MDRGAWWSTVHEAAKSWMWLNNWAHTHTHTHTHTHDHLRSTWIIKIMSLFYNQLIRNLNSIRKIPSQHSVDVFGWITGEWKYWGDTLRILFTTKCFVIIVIFLNVYTERYHLWWMFTFIHLFESHNNPIKKCLLHFTSKESKHVSPCWISGI